MIELKNITKQYRLGIMGNKHITAADNVTFSIKEGQIVSLIGESGSGKSTIGKMILGLLKPTSGQIMFEGTDITGIKNKNLKEYYFNVQGVFQDPFSSFNPIFKADRIFNEVHKEFYPDMRTNEWKNRLNDALHSVGLNPDRIMNKFPHQLSGGQLQRLLIARALLLDVKFLVADEIISMLDASTRIDVLNLLGELKKRGLSILFITHDLHLGYYISDSVLIMYRGSIVEMGSTEEVFNYPLHPYTKMLFDAVPRLDRHWDDSDDKVNNVTAEFSERLCKYHDRCSQQCGRDHAPLLSQINREHYVACNGVK